MDLILIHYLPSPSVCLRVHNLGKLDFGGVRNAVFVKSLNSSLGELDTIVKVRYLINRGPWQSRWKFLHQTLRGDLQYGNNFPAFSLHMLLCPLIREKRLHVPQVDRIPEEPPPRLVTIVGPPGVGKTTLLKSLVKRYAKETLSDPQGPITVVTSKKQRLMFVECPNELEAMVDMAKVADIVLLMIDGNFGFEMETMEFLNILTTTGMPGNVFGILTHLDLFRKPQTLKDAKKRLKNRFWSELYQGAHLFYLSGVINGRYPDREIHNLSRFISVMKNPRPLIWRNSHPYTIIDSFRDVTHPTRIEEDAKCDRTVVLSGYLRGTNFAAQGQRVHIPGLGDCTISTIEALPDPCPTPFMDQAMAKASGKTGRRRLDEKEKKLHAPMSDKSGLKIDGDTIWITREKGFNFDADADDDERGEGEELMVGLQGERKILGQTEEGVRLFSDGGAIKNIDEDTGRKQQRFARFVERDRESGDELVDDEGFVSGEELDPGDETEITEDKLGKAFREVPDGEEEDVAFADSDSDLGSISGDEDIDSDDSDGDSDDASGDGDFRWKENILETAQKLHERKNSYRTADLAKLMYDESLTPAEVLSRWRAEIEEEDIEESDDETFFKKSGREKADELDEDRAIPRFDYEELKERWSVGENIEALRRRFATADLLKEKEKAAKDDDSDVETGDEDEDDEGDGEFQDLETGEEHKPDDIEAEREKNARRKEELKLRFEEEDREGFNNDKAQARREGGNEEEFGEDDWYDSQKAQIQKQLDINKAEFDSLDETQRVGVEGYRAGVYAKIIIEGIASEFVDRFNARIPIIIGGLSPTEDRFGFVQIRIKRHRWHKKILKTNDPLIFSMGWRRFQTMPIYSTSDSRTRNRMLKYTPEHTHCFGTFYGPLIAPRSGFTCYQSFSSKNPGFRVAATGTVLDVDESTEIVKKLKLTGTPYKIFKNTAFIKDMFTTSLEIAKFEGASIKTVSGIRGQIKRALSKPEGHFRATFEDKILMSDIVFLRAWYPIRPHRFYNPVTNLIGWEGMRLTGEVRRDQNLPTPQQKNSAYKLVERATRHFNPLRVPRALAAELPYKSQITQMKKQSKPTYMQKRAVVVGGEEKKARDLMQKLKTLRNEKVAKRRVAKEEKRKVYRKKVAENAEKREEREKKERQDYWRKEGKKRRATLSASPEQPRLALQNVPTPTPGPNDLTVTLHACALNHRDLFLRQHLYPSPSFTTPLFADGYGIVTSIGSSASKSWLGKAVILAPGRGWKDSPEGPESPTGLAILGGTSSCPLGTGQDVVCVHEDDVEEAPKHLSSAEAAALPLTGLTGWRALVTKSGNAQAGRNILVTGIGGGVALNVLQFAVGLRANVYVTSGNEEKLQKAKNMGAKGGVNYKSDSWEKDLKKQLPRDRPYLDAIIDGAGGNIIAKATRLLKVGGVVAQYGMTVGPKMDWTMNAVLLNLELKGSTMGSRKEFKDMVAFVDEKKIKPIVSKVVKGLDNITEIESLFDEMKSGSQFGKLVIEITQDSSSKL
ncbi:hypothetical protein B7494_g3294 [Chlorociboria aeruginascens]|nr:hypothetical protein B7494_g3294 [Chlorociboria aeruginascens]